MNFFYLDRDIVKCALALHDVHLNKMLTETAQMLSTAMWHSECDWAESAYARGEIMLPAFENHPVVRWAYENIAYLNTYLMTLDAEYTIRTGKQHSAARVAQALRDHGIGFSATPETEPPQCMPDAYKCADPVLSYRAYYATEKLTDRNGRWLGVWTNRKPPEWLGLGE